MAALKSPLVCVGELRHRVKLQRRTLTVSGTGAQSETWIDVMTMWARIEPLTGREYWEADQVRADATHSVLMRYRDNVNPIDRLIYNGRTFEITDVRNLNERNRWLLLTAKELR